VKTFPLDSITLEEAKRLQFHAVDYVTLEFGGEEILSAGDLGVVKGLNKPIYTKKTEKVFARFFGAPAALLVRGAGTGAIRWALISMVKPGGMLLLHRAPVYPTTKVTIESMALNALYADFNDPADIERVALENREIISGSLIQHTRQKPDDSYELEKIVRQIKRLLPGAPVVVDDNYAALKMRKIGCQAGADLSAFSSFKILGPEGVGVLVGDKG
jgi:selenocysteine lyase/cysteine desulfurase